MSASKEDRERKRGSSSSHKGHHHRHSSGKRPRTVMQDAWIQTDTRDSEAQTKLRFSKHKIAFNVDVAWEPHPLSGCLLVAGKYIVPETGWPPPPPPAARPPSPYYQQPHQLALAAAFMSSGNPFGVDQQQQQYRHQYQQQHSPALLLPPSQVFGPDGGLAVAPVSSFPPVSMMPDLQPPASELRGPIDQSQQLQNDVYPPSNGVIRIDNTQWDNAGAAETWRTEQYEQQARYADEATFVPSESLYSQESVQMQQNLTAGGGISAAAAVAAATAAAAASGSGPLDISGIADQASAATAAAAAAAAAAGSAPSTEDMQRYYSQYYDAYYRNWYTQNFNRMMTEQQQQQQQAAFAVTSPAEGGLNLNSLNPEARSVIDDALSKLKQYFGGGPSDAASQPPQMMSEMVPQPVMPSMMTIDPSVAAVIDAAGDGAASAATTSSGWQPYPDELKAKKTQRSVPLLVPPRREDLELHSSNPQRKLAWKPPPQPPPEILSDKQDAITRLAEELRRKKQAVEDAEKDALLRLKLSYSDVLNRAVSKILSLNVQYVFGSLMDLGPEEQSYFGRPPITYRMHLCDILIANVFITQGGADWKNGAQETAARQAFKLLVRPCHVVGSSRRWRGVDYLVLCLSEKNTLIPDLPPYLSNPNEPMWMKNKVLIRKDVDKRPDVKSKDAIFMDDDRFEQRNVKPLRELWLLTEGEAEDPGQIASPVRFLLNSGLFSNMMVSFEFEVLSNGLFNCALFVDKQYAGYGYGSSVDKAREFAARNATNNLFHKQMRVAVDVSGNRGPLDPSVIWDKEIDPIHYLIYVKMERLTEFREKTFRQDFTQLLNHYTQNTPEFLQPLKFHQRDWEAKWPMFIECACQSGLFYRIVGTGEKFRQLLICKKLPLTLFRDLLQSEGNCGRYWVVSRGSDTQNTFEEPPPVSEMRPRAPSAEKEDGDGGDAPEAEAAAAVAEAEAASAVAEAEAAAAAAEAEAEVPAATVISESVAAEAEPAAEPSQLQHSFTSKRSSPPQPQHQQLQRPPPPQQLPLQKPTPPPPPAPPLLQLSQHLSRARYNPPLLPGPLNSRPQNFQPMSFSRFAATAQSPQPPLAMRPFLPRRP